MRKRYYMSLYCNSALIFDNNSCNESEMNEVGARKGEREIRGEGERDGRERGGAII